MRIWDPDTGALLTTPAGRTGPVRALAYRPDGTQLATAGDDGTVRIWDCDNWDNSLAIGILAPDRLGIGGMWPGVRPPTQVLHAEGDAWRALRWEEPRPNAFPLVHHLEDVSEASSAHEK